MIGLIIFAALAAAAPASPDTASSDAAQTGIVVTDCYQQHLPFDDGTAADVFASAVVSACSKQLDGMEEIYRLQVVALAKSRTMLSRQQQDALVLQMLEGRPALMTQLRKSTLTAVVRARREKAEAVR